MPKGRSLKKHSYGILISLTTMNILNNTSADFVLMSADVLLKIAIVLSKMRNRKTEFLKYPCQTCCGQSLTCFLKTDLTGLYRNNLITAKSGHFVEGFEDKIRYLDRVK